MISSTQSPYFSAITASASGLSAESKRMEVIANNVANANTTRGVDGEPFRRQEVIFSSLLGEADGSPGGVEVVDVRPDMSELPRVYKPGHPHADADGYVTMPNIVVSNEMVDLIVASRAYEANLNAIRTFTDMANSTLELLR